MGYLLLVEELTKCYWGMLFSSECDIATTDEETLHPLEWCRCSQADTQAIAIVVL